MITHDASRSIEGGCRITLGVRNSNSSPTRLEQHIITASKGPNASYLSVNQIMRLWSLLPIILTLINAPDATASSATPPIVLTPDFVQAVQQIVDADWIPGLTLAVVYKNGPPELGAWGIKDEDGTNMTTDVRSAFILDGLRGTDGMTICFVDAFQSRLLLKGLPLCFSWDPNRRLCAWAEHNTLACGLINTELEDQGDRHPSK